MSAQTQQTQIALVTGASRGIGAAIAAQLAADGYFVIGTATTVQGAAQISRCLGENGCGQVLDVRDAAAIDSVVTEIEQRFGDVAILINNAGVTQDNLLLRMNEQDWDTVLDVQLKAVYRLSKRVLKGMVKARFGRIVNISSVVAHIGNSGQTNYAAAKAAIEAFGRTLAAEMGSRNITVNAIAPGYIQTDMTEQLAPEVQQQLQQKIPLARLGQAQDIANAVSFLVSERAAYITGTVLHVNGGLYMN